MFDAGAGEETTARLREGCNGIVVDFARDESTLCHRVATDHFTGVLMHALRGTRHVPACFSAWGRLWRDAMRNLNTFYFPHDGCARNDQRILTIRTDHGAAGYGVFW